MSAATEPRPLVARLVAPGVTDPDIDWVPAVTPQFNHHYVWLDASRPSIGKLFVFLPGVGPQSPRPRVYQFVQQEAARVGYHVIGLMYPTNVGAAVCTGGPDPNCYENVRLEIIDGVDRSGLVDVNRANSIDTRLAKLLLYLDAQFPDEGWSKFLHKGEPKWSQIAVGGHSGGAGQALRRSPGPDEVNGARRGAESAAVQILSTSLPIPSCTRRSMSMKRGELTAAAGSTEIAEILARGGVSTSPAHPPMSLTQHLRSCI